MLSRSETFCSAGKTTIGAVPRQYNEIRVVEINHDIYSKHTFTVKICNYKKIKIMDRANNSLKYIALQKRYFYQKAWKLQKKSSRVTPKTYERKMQKFCIYERLGCKIPHGLFPAKFTINTTPPPPPGGIHYDGPYGEVPPERGIFLRRA